MPYADISGNRLYYQDSGGTGTPLIFSHGFLLDRTIWDGVRAALGAGVRTIVHDERGHGLSECRDRYTMWDLGDDVVALLDLCDVEEAVLVGHSQGGYLSLRAALAHPSRVAGLVLVDSAPNAGVPEITEYLRTVADRWCSDGPLGELADFMIAAQFGPDVNGDEWRNKWAARAPSAWRVPWDSVIDGHDDVAGRLGEISSPVTVVIGEHDESIAAAAQHLRRDIPTCAGPVEIPGAYHAPSVTHPSEVAHAIAEFVDSRFARERKATA